jgi:hypothetical protein
MVQETLKITQQFTWSEEMSNMLPLCQQAFLDFLETQPFFQLATNDTSGGSSRICLKLFLHLSVNIFPCSGTVVPQTTPP